MYPGLWCIAPQALHLICVAHCQTFLDLAPCRLHKEGKGTEQSVQSKGSMLRLWACLLLARVALHDQDMVSRAVGRSCDADDDA